jgi:hypothetical protein
LLFSKALKIDLPEDCWVEFGPWVRGSTCIPLSSSRKGCVSEEYRRDVSLIPDSKAMDGRLGTSSLSYMAKDRAGYLILLRTMMCLDPNRSLVLN